MINNLLNNNLDKIAYFDNAVFFCMNSSDQRIPVSLIKNVEITDSNILQFYSPHLPVLEHNGNAFAAELYFYKKGLSINVHGIAWFVNKDELTVQFKVLHVESFGQFEEKPYSFHETISEFFSNTSMFFKRMLVTGF